MSVKGQNMQNVTPFPTKIEVVQPTRKKETPQQPQQLSFLKMTAAVVIGNGIVLAGLFCLFLLYLNMITFID
jgi:hypothetical protein